MRRTKGRTGMIFFFVVIMLIICAGIGILTLYQADLNSKDNSLIKVRKKAQKILNEMRTF